MSLSRNNLSWVLLVGAFAAIVSIPCASAYNNGLGKKPVMGWNTWCTDDICGIIDKCTDAEIRSVADAIVEQGLDKLGYEYLNMDDCWSDTKRNATGHLQPNPQQFPNGMKALADYVHSKGLKIGLYTCIGTETCHGGRPGSFGHYDIDAQTIASWGMDFVKCDNCFKPSQYSEQELYSNFSAALNATGRPILFSLCEWGDADVLEWGAEYGQMFRITQDHLPLWWAPDTGSGKATGGGVINIIEYVASIKPSQFIKPYGILDMDFLETLFPITMSFVDSRTEYSFWSIWSAPLLVSTDVRNMSAEMSSIIANPEVIAIDQDDLITAGDRVANYTNGGQVWSRQLANGDKAILLFNPMTEPINVPVTWTQVGWPAGSSVSLRDLWKRQDAGVFHTGYNATIGKHDVQYFRATLQHSASGAAMSNDHSRPKSGLPVAANA